MFQNKGGFGGFNTSASFGSNSAANTSAFGSSGFNAQTSTASGGLFGGGTSTSTGGGIFGGGSSTSANTPGFGGGGTNSAFSFGSSNNAFSLGQNQQSTPAQQPNAGGLFGGGMNQSSGIFGTPATSTAFGSSTPQAGGGGLFGSTNTSTGAGVFGSSAASAGFNVQQPQQQNGTVLKFNPLTGSDSMMKGGQTQSIQTKHQCITAMKEYEGKSLEELRVEDYMANRKGPSAGSTVSGGLFGATQTTQASTGFNFGNQQNKTTGFGGFGQTSTSTAGGLFGNQQQQTSTGTGLFGANKPALFGSTATTTATTTGFGGFGQTSTAGSTSLFNANTQQKPSIFGQPAATSQPAIGFGQGATQTSGFGGFGATNTAQPQQAGSLFANANKTGFGQTNTNTGFNFGGNTQQTSSFNFGKSTAATGTTFGGFGQNTSTGFGNTANTGTGLFGNKPTGFGQPTNNTLGGFGTGLTGGLNTGGGLFGNTQKPATGLNLGGGGFSTGIGGNQLGGGLNLGGNTTMNAADLSGAAQQAQLQQQLVLLSSMPYGDSTLVQNLQSDKKEERLKPTNPQAQRASLAINTQLKFSPRPSSKIKPKPLPSITGGKSQLFEGLEDDDFSFGSDLFFPRRSVKKLVIKSHDNKSQTDRSEVPSLDEGPPKELVTNLHTKFLEGKENVESPVSPPATSTYKTANTSLDNTIMELNAKKHANSIEANSTADDFSDNISEIESEPHPAGIILRRHGYYTMPSLEELVDLIDKDGSCVVENFVVGREGYGNVLFPGKTDVSNMNLDEIVHFRRKEVTIYPDDDNKPDVGEDLNKRAQVTLDCVWPIDKNSQVLIKDPERLVSMNYQEKIERASVKIGAKFIDYRPETGSWVFEVKHFSKYGMVEDSDDEDEKATAPKVPFQAKPPAQPVKAQVNEAKEITTSPKELQAEVKAPVVAMDEDDAMDETQVLQTTIHVEKPTEPALPVSHRLATHLGVTPKQLQLQKASFFGDDEDDMDMTTNVGRFLSPAVPSFKLTPPASAVPTLTSITHTPPAFGALPWSPAIPQKRDLVIPKLETSKLFSPKRPAFDHGLTKMMYGEEESPLKKEDMHEVKHMVIPSGLDTIVKPRKIVGTRVPRVVPSLSQSVTCDKHMMLMDAAMFHSRQSRVGWSNGWTLAHNGSSLSPLDEEEKKPYGFLTEQPIKSKLTETGFNVTLEKIVSPVDYESVTDQRDHLEALMEIQLKHAELYDLDTECPAFRASPGVSALHRYADMSSSLANGHLDSAGEVWSLCVALWGEVPRPATQDETADVGGYVEELVRKEALSSWLESVSERKVQKEILQSSQCERALSAVAVFSCLTGRCLDEACSKAQDVGDHTVALSVSQATGSDIIRQMLKTQLDQWQQTKMDLHIDVEYMKIYVLLAGLLTWTSNENEINVCEGLDWKRSFGLHLWYHCSATASITDALEAYKASVEAGTSVRPLPSYLADCESGVRDICFHLLQLFCDASHPLDSLLNPSSVTANHLDYSLSWHLVCVLQALGFSHLSEHRTSVIICSYASQLEAAGLWHLAAFVLMHLNDSHRRQASISALIMRHIQLHADEEAAEREKFLTSQLHLPVTWLHAAKALVARVQGTPEEEAWHLLHAKKWNQCHRVVVEQLASQAIIHENYEHLKTYLSQLSSPEISCQIQDWSIGGQVYMDYIHMIDTLQQLRQGEPSVYELEKLQVEVSSLSKRIGSLVANNATDRFAQSEMAKRTANLMYTLLMMQSAHDGTVPANFSGWQDVCDLPLPEDYALQELHQLTGAHLVQIMQSAGV